MKHKTPSSLGHYHGLKESPNTVIKSLLTNEAVQYNMCKQWQYKFLRHLWGQNDSNSQNKCEEIVKKKSCEIDGKMLIGGMA